MLLSRRVWAGVIAALPPFVLSMWFVNVYVEPESGANREWAEDAKLLVRLEFLMLFVAVLTGWIASHVSALRRVAAMVALGAVFGAIVYGLWAYTDGSDVVLGAGLLIAGRFLSGVIAGPGATAELFERAAVGLLFYFAVLFLVYLLPEMLPGRYSYRLHDPAVAVCALYYLLLALVEAAQIYMNSPAIASRRPSVVLESSDAFVQSSLQLRFAGNAVEIVRTTRARPAGRIAAFFFGAAAVGLGIGAAIATRGEWTGLAFALIPLAMGGAIVVNSLRGGASARSVQVRHGELARLDISRGRLKEVELLAAADIERLLIEKAPDPETPWFHLYARLRNGELRVIVDNLDREAEAAKLQRLVELYLKGRVQPESLRKEFAADPELAAMLGPKLIERLLAASPLPVRNGSMRCTECRSEIPAIAPRCPHCGILYPAAES